MMNILNDIESDYGKKEVITFIRGLWDWQDKFIFQECLSKDGLFFIDVLTDNNNGNTIKYIIGDTFYKGLTCEFEDIISIDYTSYTRSKEIALDFADSEQNGDGLVIEMCGLGFSIALITDDIVKWLKENKDLAKNDLGIDNIDIAFSDYEVEDEVIAHLNIDDVNILDFA